MVQWSTRGEEVSGRWLAKNPHEIAGMTPGSEKNDFSKLR